MVGGPICFALVCFLPLTVGYKSLGNWGGIILLCVLQGLGRGVWEATNKAIFVDYFDYDTLGAGANIIIQNGGAGAVGFFINAYGHIVPSCTEGDDDQCPAYSPMAWAVVISSVLAVVGFLLATVLKEREQAQKLKDLDGDENLIE